MESINLSSIEFLSNNFERDQARLLLPYMRADEYFYYILRIIVRFDLEQKKEPVYKKDLIDRFNFVAKKILRDKLNVNIDTGSNQVYEWEQHHEQYANEIDAYRSCLDNILFDSETNEQFFGISTKFKDVDQMGIQVSALLQKQMLVGYILANNRIKNDKNDDYIGFSFADYMQNEIIIYPSIRGIANLTSYNNKGKGEKEDALSELLEKGGFKVNREQMFLDDYESIVSIEIKSKKYNYYIQNGDWMSNFISNKVNGEAGKIYGHWCQINFREEK